MIFTKNGVRYRIGWHGLFVWAGDCWSMCILNVDESRILPL